MYRTRDKCVSSDVRDQLGQSFAEFLKYALGSRWRRQRSLGANYFRGEEPSREGMM